MTGTRNPWLLVREAAQRRTAQQFSPKSSRCHTQFLAYAVETVHVKIMHFSMVFLKV